MLGLTHPKSIGGYAATPRGASGIGGSVGASRHAKSAAVFCFVMFQGCLCGVTKAAGTFDSQMSAIEIRILGGMVNKCDQLTDGRNVILNGCPVLMPKRIVLGTQHSGVR